MSVVDVVQTEKDLEVAFRRSTLICRGAVRIRGDAVFAEGRTPRVRVEADGSFFNAHCLVHGPFSSLEALRRGLSWRDRASVFALVDRYLSSAIAYVEGSPGSPAAWDIFWGQQSGSRSTPVRFPPAYPRGMFAPERLSLEEYLRGAARIERMDRAGPKLPIGP